MNWKDKFKVVSLDVNSNEDIEQDFFIKEQGAPEKFIDKIKQDYPFVTNGYLDFLELTDGADIAQCRFLESSNFEAYSKQYGVQYSSVKWIPIGFEAGGDPILLNADGKIVLGFSGISTQEFDVLADSFDEFLEQVLMGQRYASIFRVPKIETMEFYLEEIEEDPWLEYLVSKGWVIMEN